jgi:signal transduction histidine kinase
MEITLPKTPSMRLDGRRALVTGAGRGIGLGLPKALRLIESNGGGLVVESRPGEGTRVVVNLPMVVQGPA